MSSVFASLVDVNLQTPLWFNIVLATLVLIFILDSVRQWVQEWKGRKMISKKVFGYIDEGLD
jgi:hypothetical protein